MNKVLSVIIAILLASYGSMALSGESQDLTAFNHAYEQYEQLYAQGALRRALPEARQAYELGGKLFGVNSEDAANLAYNYGNNLLQLGYYEEAASVLTAALGSFEKIHGKNSVELVPVLMGLGHANANLSNNKTMKKHYGRALKLSKKHFGENSARFGWFSVKAGVDILNLAHERSGEKYLRSGYKILLASLGDEHVQTGFAAYHLGTLELAADNHEAAKKFLLGALATFEQPGEPSNKFQLSTHAFLIHAYQALGESKSATEHCLAIGRMTPFASTQEYFPIYKRPPVYPFSALNRGIEGYVILEYSVDESGMVRDPVLIDSQGHPDFDDVAFSSVKDFRYAPRFVDGQPVMVEGVQNKFTFKINNSSNPALQGSMDARRMDPMRAQRGG